MAKLNAKSSIKRLGADGKEEKYFFIKVPVYSSIEKNDGQEKFGELTYDSMINYLKDKLDDHEDLKLERHQRKDKLAAKVIEGLTYEVVETDSKTSMLLLKASASITNVNDGFLKDKKGSTNAISKESRLGSENNFILFYPKIIGANQFKYQWYVLVYEDPNKSSSDIIETTKIILKYLDIDVINIKPQDVLDELEKQVFFKDFTYTLTSFNYRQDGNEVEEKEYLFNSVIKNIKTYNYKDIPAINGLKILKSLETIKVEESVKKIFANFKFSINKKIFKVKREFTRSSASNILEASIEETNISENVTDSMKMLNEKVEEMYNSRTKIYESDLETKVYETDFIIGKLLPILSNYINSTKQ